MMKPVLLVPLALSLGACVAAPPPAYLAASADPFVGLRGPGYVAVTAGVRNYDVVEPLDWRELNRRVTPGAAPHRDDSNGTARPGQ